MRLWRIYTISTASFFFSVSPEGWRRGYTLVHHRVTFRDKHLYTLTFKPTINWVKKYNHAFNIVFETRTFWKHLKMITANIKPFWSLRNLFSRYLFSRPLMVYHIFLPSSIALPLKRKTCVHFLYEIYNKHKHFFVPSYDQMRLFGQIRITLS